MPSRRQFIGGAAAVGAAWVTPTIMTAKPTEGATLSFGPGVTAPPAAAGPAAPAAHTAHASGTLPFTGDDLERDATIGAALAAGGWLIHHWAARGKTFPR